MIKKQVLAYFIFYLGLTDLKAALVTEQVKNMVFLVFINGI